MPVISVAPNDQLLDKLKSNLEEVQARGGELYVVADDDVEIDSDGVRGAVIKLNSGGNMIAPAVFTVPLQLLAYHVAVLRGTDVDQPRNLAKSVTVTITRSRLNLADCLRNRAAPWSMAVVPPAPWVR
jgi:glucosamine--fructose-6-phosphate aminotransferase (isomerizing)